MINLGRNPLLRLAVYSIVSAVLAGMLIELTLRIIGYIPLDVNLNYHDDMARLHHRGLDNDNLPFCLIPNASHSFRLVRGGTDHRPAVDYRINDLGLRSPPLVTDQPGVTRIVVLGDSMTFGWDVSEDQTFVSIAQRQIAPVIKDAVLINAGIPGYNIANELDWLTARGLSLKPKIVILGFVINDIADPIDMFGWYQVLANRRLIKSHTIPNSDRFYRRLHDLRRSVYDGELKVSRSALSPTSRLKLLIAQHSAAVELVRQWRFKQFLSTARTPSPGLVDQWSAALEREQSPERIWLMNMMKALDRLSRKHKFALGILIIPHPRQILVPANAKASANFADDLRDLGIPTVNGAEYIRGSDFWDNYLLDYYHLSPVGHQRLSTALIDLIMILKKNNRVSANRLEFGFHK